MDIRRLPGGGAGFSAGGFASRLASATKYTGLRDKYQKLAGIVKASAGSIRSGKFDSRSAMEKFRSAEKDLSWDEKRDARQILKHLEESAADAAEQRAASLSHPVKSENEGYRVDRAGVLRARRAYEQMQKVGSREMQKKTYAQLQEAESKLGEKERSRFGGAPAGAGLAGQGRPGIAGPAGGGSPYRSAASSGDSFRLK